MGLSTHVLDTMHGGPAAGMKVSLFTTTPDGQATLVKSFTLNHDGRNPDGPLYDNASLKKGGKFEDIAKKQSKDPGSGANGGDLDWANPNSFVKEFSQAMVELKKGQVTDKPVKTQFGFHIIRLDDTRESPVPKFDEVKAQIAQQLQQGKLAEYQQGLREKAKIE
jgi:hypothetical protein